MGEGFGGYLGASPGPRLGHGVLRSGNLPPAWRCGESAVMLRKAEQKVTARDELRRQQQCSHGGTRWGQRGLGRELQRL